MIVICVEISSSVVLGIPVEVQFTTVDYTTTSNSSPMD